MDLAFLVWLRVLVGGVFVWLAGTHLFGGLIAEKFLLPAYLFTYPGFEWVKPWPGNGLYVHFAVLGLAAFLVLVGAAYRLAATVLFLAFAYVFLLDKAAYLNHYVLLLLFAFTMIFLPAHRACSVDARFGWTRASSTAPAWTLHLLRTTIGLLYFYAGLAKIDGDWLRGYPLIPWCADTAFASRIGDRVTPEALGLAMSYAGLAFDLAVWPALLWSRTRPAALVAMLAFHLVNAKIWTIGVFPWFSIGATLLFLPPDFPRRVLRRIGMAASDPAAGTAAAPGSSGGAGRWSRRQKLVATAVAGFVMLQVLVPLRPLFYPGRSSWTEEGMLFSWHQKLRAKHGTASFLVRDKESGRAQLVEAPRLMDARRAELLAGQPDMILEYAHFLAAETLRENGLDVEVYALTAVSLNMREPQPIVDPAVDLTRRTRTFFAPYDFILPLEVPLSDQIGAMPSQGETSRRLLERQKETAAALLGR